MDRESFLQRARPRWHALELALGTPWRKHGASIARTVSLYRQLCSDIMRARALGCGTDVESYLDGLAAQAHNELYRSRDHRLQAAGALVVHAFPAALRRAWPFVVLSTLLLGIPFAVGLVGSLASVQFAENVLPVEMLEQMADAYSQGFAEGRESGVDAAMAGFYVYNNVGIAFRCFATGILLGLGSAFFLVYNGLVLGTVSGFVSQSGGGLNLFTFIVGHGPFELGAIVISGAAGLRMGYALIDTGGLTRWGSLRAVAPDLVALIAGAAVMLLIAAGVEGFWSPSSVANEIKWAVGAFNLLLLVVFFGWCGRSPRKVTGP